jgi:hypothetical protein
MAVSFAGTTNGLNFHVFGNNPNPDTVNWVNAFGNAGDLVVVAVLLGTNTPGVTLSSSPSLTFAQRGSTITYTDSDPQTWTLQIFEAILPRTLTSADTLTFNYASANDYRAHIAFALHGFFSSAAPHDTSASFTQQYSDVSAIPSITYSTAEAHDLLLYFTMGEGGANNGTPSGWSSTIGGVGNLRVFDKSVSTIQTAQTVASPSAGPGMNFLDAFTADAPPVVGYQTFVTMIG